ncbi:hypothetical protein Golomagni_05642 [Golovinomyces magnicellulatus]|nr:hypothetical protein Golomagni_05642 [Golovinomyces magnicellulatus]
MASITGKDKDELSPSGLSDQEASLDADHGINEKALLRKIDARLLPAVGILYLLSFLDRSNGTVHPMSSSGGVGNARIEGMITDINITGNQYLTGLTVYFIGYVLFEVTQRGSPPA